MGRKLGRTLPFFGRGAGSPSSTMWPRPRPTSKCHLDPSSRFATIDMGRKLGTVPPFSGGGAESPSNTMSPGTRPIFLPSGILIHPAIWPQQIWTENWDLCPFGGGQLSPHLTQRGQGRDLPAHQVSSWSIESFGHNTPSQTDRQHRTHRTDRTDNYLIAYGELFYKRSPKNLSIIDMNTLGLLTVLVT